MKVSALVTGCFVALSFHSLLHAQISPPEPLAFDVAAIRKSNQETAATHEASNVPLGPGNVYSSTGGRFSASDFPLLNYITFAYRMTDAQLEAFRSQIPDWVRTTRFNIEARTDKSDVTKDQLRLMMRALLADRFHLAVHSEARSKSVYNLLLVKPGTTGPKLFPHVPGSDCPSTLPLSTSASEIPRSETVDGGYPTTCGAILLLPSTAAGNVTIGGRDVRLPLLASSLTGWGDLGRPVVDQTGLAASYDFVLTYLPQQGSDAPSANLEGPDFRQALRQQLGLRLESARADVQILILDHIDHVTGN